MQKKAGQHIKFDIILLLLVHFFTIRISAQYVNSGISLTKTYNSAVNWVNIDCDGDLDLAISGYTPFISAGQLYLNNSNVITYLKDIRPMTSGDQKWCDFNNDGRPDLLYAGSTTVPAAGIDVFDVSLNYTSFPVSFTPLSNASVDWGDYDNDGDYDVLISGQDASGNVVTKLYANNKGSFSEVPTNLPGIMNGKVGFIDYDLDGDLDIFITGTDINGNKYTRLWKNTGGNFTVTNDLFVNLEYSSFDWGDFNGDGYPDLLLGGYDNTSGRGFLYINNAGISFTLSGLKVPLFQQGSLGFGDVDNDGDLDVFVSGIKVSPLITDKFIFLNNGTDSLMPANFTSDPVSKGFFNFGDYDGDGDLDIVFNGKKSNGNGLTIIADNLCTTPNVKPSAPLNLTAVVEGTTVILKWNRATDNNTPQKSLTYNIYMGTVSGGIDIVTPNASVSTGFRRISRPGYIQDTAWIIKNLPVGTYHWGVQSIDNSFAASSFSTESTFEIKERFTKIPYTESISSPAVYFDCDHDGDLDLFLNSDDVFRAVENTLTPFTQANNKIILANGYNPIKTLTPNDYDNNNLIDFTISGNYTINGLLDSTIALFGFNDRFNYNIIDSALVKNVSFEYVLWADFNNDGRQDLITSGKTTNLGVNNKPVTYIYKNLGNGVFQNVSHSIRGFEKCGAIAGDFDNDMDIDVIIYGKDSLGIPNTYVYINNGDFNFSEEIIPNNELYRQYANYGIQTGDFDLNGTLDIYMAGVNVLNDYYARVLLNQNMNFTDANLPIRSSPTMSNFWADYDYDGDLDIFSTSSYSSPDKVRLYLNNNGTLEETIIDLGAAQKLDMPFMAVNLDNKNGLDFLMKKNTGDYNQYFDNWGSDKRITAAPANIQFEQDKLDIILKWDKLPDCQGCTYNIRVGTQPDNVDIMSPMSDLSTGYRYVIQPGNAYLNDRWKLLNLPVGTYYWSVQAIDPANTGGPWAPVASFTVTQINTEFSFTTVCYKDSTCFNDLSVSTNSVTGWKWDFDDGTKSTLKNPKHYFTDAGTYNVVLWAYSESGDSAYKSHVVTVKPVPVADFSANVACQGTPTSFANITNTNGFTISNWLWNFGDGQSSTLQNPGTHGYLNPGNYLPQLWVFADNGCSASAQKTITVGSYPVAVVTASSPLAFCKGDSVTLSAPYNINYSYNWMVDGVSLTGGDSIRYVARLSGSYSVEVVNSTGSCKTTSSPVVITAQNAPVAPLISAGGPMQFCQGDSVTLSVINTAGYTYQWKLNGGAVGTNSNQFVAKNPGTYNIVVSNINGCSVSSSNSVNVVVNSLPVTSAVNLSGPTQFCEGGSITLSIPSTSGYSYNWRNENGLISSANTNSYTATASGNYQLDITNASGCVIKTSPVNVVVKPMPYKPVITSDNYKAGKCLGETPIRLNVRDVVAGYDYQWYKNGVPISNGTLSYLEGFLSQGDYSLEADLGGCRSESDILNVYFEDAPEKPFIYAQGPSVWYLVCSNDSATRYKWYYNGSLIPGADNYLYVANHKLGKYNVSIANTKGCYTMSDTLKIPPGATGIEDIDPFAGLKIYPNPTTGLFSIEMENRVFGELKISILDQVGKEILNIKFEKTTGHFSSQIDLSGQAKGLYLINIRLDKYFNNNKIIIE